MERKIKYVILAVVLLLGGFCLYMGIRFPEWKAIESDMTQEKLLREMPEIAISDKDLELEKYVIALPEVQEMIQRSKNGEVGAHIPEKEAESLLSQYMEEGWSVDELAAIHQEGVYLSFCAGNEKTVFYGFSFADEYPMTKNIRIIGKTWRGEEETKAIYSNINGKISKIVLRRDWFGWAKELLENGYRDNKFFGS